ncbi:hypothetical protein HPP92_016633 [Vanilla planifolia]|uniref:Lon protease AAA+ ATPase lid domain-containing protein n=1 Tax=Vanilla planifolia TaxID=51239 RepID=A0A835US93_VANPL|nr:hypothetical protein HPP92_016633 [Vanilla planifolia]
MEVIAIAGYITDEKKHIARDYLEKSTREACGIKPEQVEVTDSALLELIENYCREAGVRNLQKQIEKIYRKIALQLVRKGVFNEPSSTASIQPQIKESSKLSKTESVEVVGDSQNYEENSDGDVTSQQATDAAETSSIENPKEPDEQSEVGKAIEGLTKKRNLLLIQPWTKL